MPALPAAAPQLRPRPRAGTGPATPTPPTTSTTKNARRTAATKDLTDAQQLTLNHQRAQSTPMPRAPHSVPSQHRCLAGVIPVPALERGPALQRQRHRQRPPQRTPRRTAATKKNLTDAQQLTLNHQRPQSTPMPRAPTRGPDLDRRVQLRANNRPSRRQRDRLDPQTAPSPTVPPKDPPNDLDQPALLRRQPQRPPRPHPRRSLLL